MGNMDLKTLSRLLNEAASKGAKDALADAACLSNTLSKAQAYRLYGRSIVDRWLVEKLISPVLTGGKNTKKYFDKIQLERVAGASNRISYLPAKKRV